ncbi:caspase family protein [Rhodobacteraceae bacterium CCMM004]|nr:caspase family protein [Rhodobacteraceae bacterium CCMM004]
MGGLRHMILGLCAGLAPLSAGAEVRALLVGVSDYLVLDADLRGPANDVRLMARTLAARGADRITVLADPTRVPEAEEAPTRAAILAALSALGEGLGPGDTAIFYFSGHGSQAPDLNGDEAGGYDEIFLPADAAGWSGSTGTVENALVDDELGPIFQQMLDRGVQVVGLIDACHSATGFRALGDAAGVARYVPPTLLGLPAEAAPVAGGQAAPPLTGDFAFLYSSQSDERSFEFPLGDPEDPSTWYGDFTRSLAAVLAGVPDLTWGQALEAARDAMRGGSGGAVQAPDGEGPGLASPVFGGAAAEGRLRIEGGKVQAGLLDGLAEGAVVAVYAGAAGGEPLGRATLASVGPTTSEVGALPEGARFAEVVQPGAPRPLRLAPPVAADPSDPESVALARRFAEAAATLDGVAVAGGPVDAGVVVTGGVAVLTGPGGVVDPQGPGSSPRLTGDPAAALDRAARVHRLYAALALAAGGARGFTIPGVGLTATATRIAGSPAGPDCGPTDAPETPWREGEIVGHCDQIWLTLSNTAIEAQDVTVLYIGRDLSISPIWPPSGLSNRVAFGESQEIGMEIRAPGGGPGTEEIVVIAVPAGANAPRTVLTGLADAAPTRALGEGAQALETWLLSAADPETVTRNFGFTGALPQPKITRIGLSLGTQD